MHSVSLPELLREFQTQQDSNPDIADRSLLEEGRGRLRRMLDEEGIPLDARTMHVGRALLHLLADRDLLLPLLERYRSQPLSLSEETWARWHFVDNLAMAQRDREVVAAQREFLDWARSVFPQRLPCLSRDFPFEPLEIEAGEVLGATPAEAAAVLPESCLYLWLIGDATQAECWKRAGEGEEWLQMFREVDAVTAATPDNRFRRFNVLRTAVDMNRWLGRIREAREIADRITAIADEESDWEEATRWRIEGGVCELRISITSGDWQAVRKAGAAITSLIEEFEQRLPHPLTPSQTRRLRGFCHNAALPLRGACQYDMALPLLERAMALGMQNPWTYLSLAAARWAISGERERESVLALLQKAADRFPVFDLWAEENRPAEFEAVKEDPEFLHALYKE